MTKAKSRTLLTSFYLSATALFIVPSAFAADENAARAGTTVMEDCSVTMNEPRPSLPGMRVWIDPETGAIRQPTEAERKAAAERVSLDSLLNRSREGLVVEHRKDGSKFVNLQGRFLHALVMTRTPDGRLVMHCVTDERQLERADATEDAPLR